MTVIGIDLGTTYSVVASIQNGKPVLIPNAEGNDLTPSVVGFDADHHVFVGDLALERAIFDPKGTVQSVKRKMGTDHVYSIHGHNYSPVTISSFILEKLKKDTKNHLGQDVTDAVITVPAYFSDIARQATKHAAEIAGLRVVRIINEPTAATLAYGMEQKEGELVMVWDLGGGTFDVSLLEFSGGVYEVKATAGDVALGGDDWRDLIKQVLVKEFCKEWGEALGRHPEIEHRILVTAEEAKIKLSGQNSVEAILPTLMSREGRWKSIKTVITRSEFEIWSQPLCDRMLLPAKRALKDAKVKPQDLDRVILVGGATRMPMVRQRIAQFTGKDPYVDIDPDKAVAIGAAIQAGIIEGSLKKVVLVDVIPLSLGIETQGGICTRLIERNSKVPISKDRIFTTALDNQSEVDIHVLQGEREMANHNVSLGKFTLTDIPMASKGEPKVNVTFSVDHNGILHVSAQEVYTGQKQKMTIRSTKLDNEEIKKLIEEAKQYRESDQAMKDQIMSRVQLDRLICTAKQSLEEIGALHSEQYLKIAALLEEAEDLLDGGETFAIKSISEKLKETMDTLYKEWKEASGDADVLSR